MIMNSDVRAERSPLFLARIAAFVAVAVAGGLALTAVPNVELVTAICFIAGFLMGYSAGILTGAIAEGIFAGFNPLGSSLGLLLLAQVIGMAVAGLLGAFSAAILKHRRHGWRFYSTLISAGAAVTIFFDFITNLAFPIMAGFSFSQTLLTLAAGVPFALLHLGSNIAVFILFVSPLLPRLEKVLKVT
jgi:hypothetical protein